MSRIAVLGAGAWGTALALTFARSGRHEVALWSHSAVNAASIASSRENTRYLPGFALPSALRVTSVLAEAIENADIVLMVTPSEHLPAIACEMAPLLKREQILLSATKGLQQQTHQRMSEVATSATCSTVAVLSGPTFAQELAAGMPTACVVACKDDGISQRLQQELSCKELRVYRSSDVVGVELGAALKNVIAIAAGICVGLELGSNTLAALITRGIAEITRLAMSCGAQPQTLNGLAGMGDLILTCTGPLSRNRSVGIELGCGRKLDEILTGMNGKVAEGVRCATAALDLARERGVEMPITEQVDAILHGGRSPREAIQALMARPQAAE